MAAFQGALWSIYATMLCVISSVLIASGKLIPVEPRVCTNTSLTFTCSDPGNANASQYLLYIVDFVMIPESELDRGESDVNYTIPSISTADANANVVCGYGNDLYNFEDKGLASVTVYSYPKDLEEIHCEVDDYDKAMTCTWKWGQEYFGKNTPEVTCQFRAPELSASWTICNATKKGKGVTLQINSTRQGDFSLKKMEFNMTLESQCDISTSKVFPIDTNNIVRPAPAYNLTTAVLNSSCIEFHWHHRSPHHNKTHRITVTSKWNDTQVKELNVTHDTVSRINHTICDLHPSTTYTGSIEMMPIVGGYWSDESQVKGTTKEDRPSASPEVIGYTWDPLECDKGTHRRVRVFWKPVPEIDKNGEMIFYNVTLWPKGKAKIMNVDGIAASFYSVNLLGILCDMSYSVTVVAYTSIGGSPHNSSFIVLRHSTIERPHFMVESVSNNSSESGTNTVDVVILGDSVEQMTKSRAHYMICWCEKDRGSCKRMSVLQCVPSQMKTTSLQLADPENKMYAVAMVTKAGDISSLALESCIYPKNIAPTVSPNSVKASPGSEDNTINVIWDKLTCQSWQPFIAFYVLQYCTVVKEGINFCKGTVDSVEVPEKDYSYMLTDLKEDEVYRIVVRGMTRDGKSTPDSEPAFAQAINKTLKPSVILGIAFGCVVALAFAIAGFVCTVRKCNYRRKEFLRSKREIVDLPISDPIEQNDITLENYTRYSDPANVIHDENHAQDKGLDNNGYLVPSDRNIPINEELHNDKKRIERQGSKDSGYPMSPTNSPPPDDYSWVRENESGSSTSDDANNEKKDGVVDRMPHKDSTDPLMPGVVNSDYVLNVGDTSVKQLNESGDGADKTCNARDDGETLQKEVDNGNVDSTKDSGFTEKSFLRTKSNQHISICSDNSLDDYRKATISEEGSQCSRRSLQSKNTGNVRLSDQKSLNTDNVQYTENPELSQTEQDSLPSSRHISLQSISSDASVQMIEQIHAKNLLLENKLHITNIPVPTLFNVSNSSILGLCINEKNSDSYSQPSQGSSGQEPVADYMILADQTPQGQGHIENIVEPIELEDNDQVEREFNLGQDYVQAQSINVGQGQDYIQNQAYVQAQANQVQGQDYIQNPQRVEVQANLVQDHDQDCILNPPKYYVKVPANLGHIQGQDHIQNPVFVQAQANQGPGEDYYQNPTGQRSRQSSGASDSQKSDSGVSSIEEPSNSPDAEPTPNFHGGYVSQNSVQAANQMMPT